jgi:hypothetical protein
VGADPKTFKCFMSQKLQGLCEDKKHVFLGAIRIEELRPRSPEQIMHDPTLLAAFESAIEKKQQEIYFAADPNSIALPKINLRAPLRKLSADVKKPRNPTELMLNMKKAWERGLLLREDFFSKKYYSLFFGIVPTDFPAPSERGNVEAGEYASFSNFSFPENAQDRQEDVSTLYLTYRRIFEEKTIFIEAGTSASLDLNTSGSNLLPSYEEILKIFGPN